MTWRFEPVSRLRCHRPSPIVRASATRVPNALPPDCTNTPPAIGAPGSGAFPVALRAPSNAPDPIKQTAAIRSPDQGHAVPCRRWTPDLCGNRPPLTAPPPNPDTRAGPGNAPTPRWCAGGNGCSKSSAGTRTPRGSRGSGNHGACGDSWRDEARRRTNTLHPAPGQRVLHRGESGTGKIANAAGQHGTLERSLGLVTRDSPEGFVCSSSLRGIPPPPSRCLIIPPAKAISSSDRAQYCRK